MSITPLIDNLIRILRRESADHPLMAEAVEAQAELLAVIRWGDTKDVAMTAERMANGIEDWVGYRGQSLHYFIREPWLSGWRRTCHNALLEAYRDATRLSHL
jgi:hypothetical protein